MRLTHIGIILMISFCMFLVLSVVDSRPYRGGRGWGKEPSGGYGGRYVKEGYKYQYLGGDDDDDEDDDDGDDKDDRGQGHAGGMGDNGRDGGRNGNNGGVGWDYHW